jgi:flavin-dependent dehydrogenase
MNQPNSGKIKTVAILGGGPAASMLATLLVRGGVKVAIYYQPKRVPLIVGESLVPAIIPMLQAIGVEEKVKSFSTFKPGATFNFRPTDNFSFFFDKLIGKTATYAYNVPRDKFDAALLETATAADTKIIELPAVLERVPNTDRVQLGTDTLAAAGDFFNGRQPDLIVDATGRVRLLPKLLEIPAHETSRRDAALFAHVDQTHLDHPGHVHTTRLDHGWSWRIPLPGRVSVGMVIGAEHLAKFGATKEERYDNLLKQDSVLSRVAKDAKRITPVMEYFNYSLASERMVGDGWALVGDTAGFIDPVFSSGLFLGMNSATLLAHAIQQGTPEAFQHYQKEAKHHLETWQEIVSYYYDGRLFTFFRVGEMLKGNPIIKLLTPHIAKHMGRIFSGAASNSPYSLGLLRFAMKNGLRGEDPKELAIR